MTDEKRASHRTNVIDIVQAVEGGSFAIRQNEERLRLALSAGRMAVWDWIVDDGTVTWNDEHFRMLGYQVSSCVPSYAAWRSRVHPDDVTRVESLIVTALVRGKDYFAEYRVVWPDGTVRSLQAFARVELNSSGRARRLYGVMLDNTERNNAERQRDILRNEVNHRIKNLLTVVQAIAHIGSPDGTNSEFLRDFQGRIHSLAASHELLIRAGWRSVDVREMMNSQLSYFSRLFDRRIFIKGPALLICSTAAQTLGLATHELMTNSIKYGAMSVATGIIYIEWRIHKISNHARSRFVMTWTESGGPAVKIPAKTGFGHSIIVEMPDHALEAQAVLSYEPTGIIWSLDAPLENIVE